MTNVEFARDLLSDLMKTQGLKELVFCPGGRNASFTPALHAATNLPITTFFDERSAAFYALGRAQAVDAPVAVLTTSGTAVAELLPAVIEAHYTETPLIVISADRPKSLRFTGAPQTIIQPGMFSHYAPTVFDGDVSQTFLLEWDRRGPVHLNVCFDEPLIDGTIAAWTGESRIGTPPAPSEYGDASAIAQFASVCQKPLVVVAGLREADRPHVKAWLLEQTVPIYLEAACGLRGDPDLESKALKSGDGHWRQREMDGVVRIGQIPTARLWRDLENGSLPVLSFSHLPWPGLSHTGAKVFPLEFLPRLNLMTRDDFNKILEEDLRQFKKLNALFETYPLAEPSWFHRLSQNIAADDLVYLGNSLPIRQWDLAAVRASRPHVFANRGVNGIDGQISSFFGLCQKERRNWAILGDLTTLYDMNGLWAQKARGSLDFKLVVMNNGGGKIFERMFKDSLFYNSHDLDFSPLAAFWRVGYQRLTEPSSIAMESGLLEIVPDREQTAAFWGAL